MYTVSVVMKVNGLHSDVRLKSVLVEHDSATSDMSNVEVVCEALVLKIVNRFLKSIRVARFLAHVLFLDPGTSTIWPSVRT